jgi:hypothetical protein
MNKQLNKNKFIKSSVYNKLGQMLSNNSSKSFGSEGFYLATNKFKAKKH